MDIPPPAIKINIFLGVDTSKVFAGRILSPEETRQSVINSKEIKKSKKNWHFWFKVRGGHRIMWQHFVDHHIPFNKLIIFSKPDVLNFPAKPGCVWTLIKLENM